VPDNTKLGGIAAIEAAAADELAEKVEVAIKAVEQAGRGLVKVRNQLGAGVPQGNEVHYLIVVQGYVNEAAFALSEAAVPAAAPETQGPKLVIG
jgi:hypothetical protein